MFAIVIPIPMVLVPFLVAIGLFFWIAEKVGDAKRKSVRRRSIGQLPPTETRKIDRDGW